MIKMFFKFTIAFTVSFVILSFKVDGQPLFNHVTSFTGPLGTEVQSSLGKSVKKSFDKTKGFFENADPKYLNDVVKNQQSSLTNSSDNEMILEDIRKDEVRKLDELINNN